MKTKLILLVLLLASCQAVSEADTPDAIYKITVENLWNATDHPATVSPGTTTFPSGAHFTVPLAISHSTPNALFTLGGLASDGFEMLAERGRVSLLITELNNQQRTEGTPYRISVGESGPLAGGTGSANRTSFNIGVKESSPLVSLASMVAPTNDWFIGLRNVSLQDADGKWMDKLVLSPNVYDAGTEEDKGFTLAGGDEVPPQKIIILDLATSFGSNKPIARITFEKQ